MSSVADSMGHFQGNLGRLERSGPLRGSCFTPRNQPSPPTTQPTTAPRPFLTAASSPTPPSGQSLGVSGGSAFPSLDL